MKKAEFVIMLESVLNGSDCKIYDKKRSDEKACSRVSTYPVSIKSKNILHCYSKIGNVGRRKILITLALM